MDSTTATQTRPAEAVSFAPAPSMPDHEPAQYQLAHLVLEIKKRRHYLDQWDGVPPTDPYFSRAAQMADQLGNEIEALKDRAHDIIDQL